MEQDVKERIYKCALKLFVQQGYNGTSIRQIAEQAGTTIPMIYYYFESKENMMLSMLQNGIAEFENTVDVEGMEPPQRLKNAIANLISYCVNNKHMTALIFQTWLGPTNYVKDIPSVKRVYDDIVKRLDVMLKEGIEKGYFRRHDHWELAQNILGIMMNYIARILIGNETVDPVRCGETTIELLINGIKKEEV